MITAPRCRHIKSNGLTCKSPALRGEPRCFFHKRQMLRHARFNSFSNPSGLAKPGDHLPLIPVEDHESIQLALSMVINGLAIGHLEPVRAKALLYGLQIASINVKNTRPEPFERYDLPLNTETDALGEDLAQPGDAVDITHPSVHREEEEARLKAWHAVHPDDDDDEEEEEEDEDGEEDEDEAEDEDDEEEYEADDDERDDEDEEADDDERDDEDEEADDEDEDDEDEDDEDGLKVVMAAAEQDLAVAHVWPSHP